MGWTRDRVMLMVGVRVGVRFLFGLTATGCQVLISGCSATGCRNSMYDDLNENGLI